MKDLIQQACRHEFEADWQRVLAAEAEGPARDEALVRARRADEVAAALWALAGPVSRPGCIAVQNGLSSKREGC